MSDISKKTDKPKGQDTKFMFVDRRTFLKGTLAVGGALAVAGCGPTKTQEAKDATSTTESKITSPSYIAVDYERCVGCRICEVECAMHHNNGIPDLTQSRIKIHYFYPPVDVPSLCAKCNDAPCVAACPDKIGALTKNETTGAVIMDPDKCIGCWDCIEACEKDRTGVIRKSEDESHIVGICDLCGGDPQCVKACPERCLSLVPVYQDGKYWANKPKDIAKSVSKLLYKNSKEV